MVELVTVESRILLSDALIHAPTQEPLGSEGRRRRFKARVTRLGRRIETGKSQRRTSLAIRNGLRVAGARRIGVQIKHRLVRRYLGRLGVVNVIQNRIGESCCWNGGRLHVRQDEA